VLLCAAGAAGAQQLPAAPRRVAPDLAAADTAPMTPAPSPVPLLRRSWVRPIASLLVPGGGQLLAGQQRGLAYLATEVWVFARALALGRQGRRQRDLYRDLAYNVARRRFTATRADGPFSYYETMEKFVESGAYDADPGAGFAPEPDSATFNGSVWLLARRTFFAEPDSLPPPGSPEYQRALAFYQQRAVTDAYRWSWHDARLEQDVYRAAIRASDESFRSATNYLGAMVINHLGSAVDGLITARLGARRGKVPHVGILDGPRELTLTWDLDF
jgi:hypothetical protein